MLRQGAKFHNGEPVTAEDVKFSFERYRGASHDLMKNRVATVETPRSASRPLQAQAAVARLPDLLRRAPPAAGWIVPKKYVEKVGDDGFKKAPIGAGPYKFVSFTPGRRAGHGGVRRAIGARSRASSASCSRSIPDEATRLAALKRGEIDIAYSIRGELAEELQRTPGSPSNRSTPPCRSGSTSPSSGTRSRHGTTSGCGGRPASLSIGKTINEALTLGYSGLTNSIIPDSFDFYWQPPAAAYDPAKAQGAARRSGSPERVSTRGEYLAATAPIANLGEAVLNNLAGGGHPRRAAAARARGVPRWHMPKRSSRTSSRAAAAPSAMRRPGSRPSSSRAAPMSTAAIPTIDALFQQQAVELDHKRRTATLHKIQQLVNERAIFRADLAVGHHATAIGPRVGEIGSRPDPTALPTAALRGHHARNPARRRRARPLREPRPPSREPRQRRAAATRDLAERPAARASRRRNIDGDDTSPHAATNS